MGVILARLMYLQPERPIKRGNAIAATPAWAER
jgi:hypothetical protein